MSKRHLEDYYEHGSIQSSRKESHYEDSKRSKHYEHRESSSSSTSHPRPKLVYPAYEDDEDEVQYKKEEQYCPKSKDETINSKNKFKSGIQIKLAPIKSATEVKPKITVASVFNQDSDDEPEEMPKEARMKMRNIGRDTPTSAGPNSFGKTKQGFCHAKRVFEKSVEKALENLKD